MMNDFLKKTAFVRSFLLKKIVHVNLQLLHDCNFRCSICDFWKEPDRHASRLSLAQVTQIAEKLQRIGPQIVSIGGGEPLMHPEIIPICKTLSAAHFPVMICNGWFITPEIARAVFEAGLHEVSISIDYADPARHDAQRGRPGAFEKAVEALKILNRSRVSPHQRVHMISVVMDDNLDDIEPLILLSRELKVTYLVTLYSDNRGKRQQRNAGPGVSSRLLALKQKYPEFVALRGYLARFDDAAQNGMFPCYAGVNLLNIDTQGNVAPCIDNPHENAGNILTDDLPSILDRLRLNKSTSTCSGCWTSCRGSIETTMYGTDRLNNFFDYYQMTRPVQLPRHERR